MDVSDPIEDPFSLPLDLNVEVVEAVKVKFDHLPDIPFMNLLVSPAAPVM